MNKKKKAILMIVICAIIMILSFGFGIYYTVKLMYTPQPIANVTLSADKVIPASYSGALKIPYELHQMLPCYGEGIL